MLSPEQVDQLMTDENMSADRIEELHKFYNRKIKDRGLDQLLTEIEHLIEMDKIQEVDQIHTPKRSAGSNFNFDIAEENYLLATQKL